MYSLKEQYGKFIIRNTCQSSDGYSSGTYFIRMSAADYVSTQQLMLVK